MRFKKKDYELELTVSEYKELEGGCEPHELPLGKKRGRPKKKKVVEDLIIKVPDKRGRKEKGKSPDELEHIKCIKQLVQDNPGIKDKVIIQRLKERFNVVYTRDKVRYWRLHTPKELLM